MASSCTHDQEAEKHRVHDCSQLEFNKVHTCTNTEEEGLVPYPPTY